MPLEGVGKEEGDGVTVRWMADFADGTLVHWGQVTSWVKARPAALQAQELTAHAGCI